MKGQPVSVIATSTDEPDEMACTADGSCVLHFTSP